MYLAIASDGVTLHEPTVVTDLYASYQERLTAERLSAVLAEHDAGHVEANGAYVAVPVARLRELAGAGGEFETLLDTVRARGLLSDDGETVRAPLERER